jgi:hypothetical protein
LHKGRWLPDQRVGVQGPTHADVQDPCGPGRSPGLVSRDCTRGFQAVRRLTNSGPAPGPLAKSS